MSALTKSARQGYSALQIGLHWIVVALIAIQLVYPDGMGHAWRTFRREGTVVYSFGAYLHIVAGVLVLAFALWRIALRFTRGVPPQPEDEPASLKLAAKLTHLSLYAIMILMPVSGLVAWYGGVDAAGEAHEVMETLLYILVGLHVAGALYQQFILKSDVLNRMRKPGN